MKITTLKLALMVSILAMSACAPKTTPIKSGTVFPKIQKISVGSFDGPGGREVANEFVQKLMASGLEVTDSTHPADAILTGAVVDYKPDHTLMVFLGKTTVVGSGGQPITVTNPILSPGALQATPLDAAGSQNAQIASVNATISVVVHLKAASSGAALWSGTYSYEGFDMTTALQTVVGVLSQALSGVLLTHSS